MSYRLKTISKLLSEGSSRRAYLKAKLNQVIPSQIRALRLREEWTQGQLAEAAEMKQSRISAMESPGEVNFSLETLIRIAATCKVGLWVEFISHSEMVRRENRFSQDDFKPVRLPEDRAFLEPSLASGSMAIPDYDYSPRPQSLQEINVWTDIASSKTDIEIHTNGYSTMNSQMGAMHG